MTPKRQLLFGLYVDALGMTDVVERCHNAILKRQRLLVGVLNAAKIVELHKNPRLRDAMIDCDLLVADGQSVVWASKLLGRPLPERVAGIDIFGNLLQLADRHALSIALLGATPEVNNSAREAIEKRYPNLKVAYSHHGYFTEAQSAAIADGIQASRADMLFLGITSPKKEIFLANHGARIDVPVQHGVGGSFDIMAGITARAPVAWQVVGMEWAYRLLQEPRRLWWRYLSTNTGFIWLSLKEMFHPSSAFSLSIRRTGERMVAHLSDQQPRGAADE